MTRRYQDLFFDLDRTLWDFDTNSKLALAEIYLLFELKDRGIVDVEAFKEVYTGINEMLWKAYRLGNVRKAELRSLRFAKTLEHFGLKDLHLGVKLGDAYLDISPLKTTLIPDTLAVLDHLAGRYRMHIITNGFDEVQGLKMTRSGLSPFFTELITSEMAAARKPDPAVFKLAFAKAGTAAVRSLMIGDDLETDIGGARNVGMDQVYFNPESVAHNEEVTHEIRALKELKALL
jgi:putative hydrolase of the HAD superfamily